MARGQLRCTGSFTAASVQGFAVARWALALTFRHRAGVTPYTSYSTLQRAVFLLNSCRSRFTATTSGYKPYRGAPSPEVTGLMCLVPERAFSRAPVDIHLVYLCRFVVRAPVVLLRGFSWQREIRDFASVWPRSRSDCSMTPWIFLRDPACTGTSGSITRLPYPSASP